MIKIINTIVIELLIICLLIFIDQLRFKNEDVNKDGVVDALDLLIVQKEIIKEHDKESD